MKKKTKVLLLLSCALVLAVGGVVVALHIVSPPPGVVWEPAPERTNKEGVTLTFSGLDVDNEADLIVLHCVLTNDSDLNIGNGFDVAVDYSLNGEWFTTYDSTKTGGFEPLPMIIQEAGTREKLISIPKKAFQHTGEYRIVLIGFVACEFEILLDL